jgi:hypothetical protein
MNSKSRRVYIAGPMTRIADYNFPAFYERAAQLEALGYRVYNPAETDISDSYPYDEVHDTVNWTVNSEAYELYLKRSLWHLTQCNAINLLPNWETSKGALLEWQVALTLGYKQIKI